MDKQPIELFYSYSHANTLLKDRLDTHLKALVRENLIAPWHDKDITAGSTWEKNLLKHLKTAQIILLLVSADFIASDYSWDIELQEALKRHDNGEARVIPIILEACDWEKTWFATLQVLPPDAKPVTLWPDQNAAFTSIAKGIRKVVNELHGINEPKPDETMKKRSHAGSEDVGRRDNMARTPATINSAVLKRAVNRYNEELKRYQEVANYELGLRSAFQNLLDDIAKHVGWALVPEMTIDKIRPDGVLIDEFKIRRGYWEAKGPETHLENEITKKIKAGYPLLNTIFEDTNRAVLYQGKKRYPVEFNLRTTNDVTDLLQQFFTYTEPDIENFKQAVDEFKERIPENAQALLTIINEEHTKNKKFRDSFATFAELCRNSLDPKMNDANIDEMLVQHLLTERLFRTVFNNSDFVRRNVIAAEIEKVIDALASRSFNRSEFLKTLDRFYVAIEKAAKGRDSWSERQDFLNTVYERFFQGFSVKQADVHGIVYTPQEIVNFMVESVNEVLKRDFDKSIETPGVKFLDPATGTGNFIINLMDHIDESYLEKKYKNDLFCNEITLLPYYISALNIEHTYYEKMGQYEAFEGICFADTLELAKEQQLSFFVEENTERVQREKDANIMVVIGNPPYNVGQLNENDNNKNRKYLVIDRRIKETYAKDSRATLMNQLYDAYVRFFRWSIDRLGNGDGIVCLVTNNSFLDQISFDSMRKHLLKDFSQIYHLDLHGNVRKNPRLSGTAHNVFGIQVGVGITIAVRSSKHLKSTIYYHRVPEYWKKFEKLAFLTEKQSIINIDWQELSPDINHTWLTQGLRSDFSALLPVGTKDSKNIRAHAEMQTIFRTYSTGINSSRDRIAYNFNYEALLNQINQFSESYNSEISRWVRAGRPQTVDDFVRYDIVKWSRNLKRDLRKENNIEVNSSKIRKSIYRPFTKMFLYFSDIILDEHGSNNLHFPLPASESENRSICLTMFGSEKPFMALATNLIPDYHLVGAGAGTQSFPFYVYSSDGNNQRENITDWVLNQFKNKYGSQVSKWNIFNYVYTMLHHPQYREFYKENLKHDLPHIPLLLNKEVFGTCVSIGKQLMDIHINYESVS